MRPITLAAGALVAALVWPLAGCQKVLGIDEDYRVGVLSGGAGGATSTGGGGAAGGTGGVGGTTTTTGGMGGTGGCPGGMADLTTFCIDTHEVTKGDYQSFLAANPDIGDQPAECAGNTDFTPAGGWPPAGGEENVPVAFVDWCDAFSYCAWAGKRLCGAIGGGPNTNATATDATVSQWHAACTQGDATAFPYGAAYQEAVCVDNGFDSVAGFDPMTDVAQPVGSASACRGSAAPYDAIFDMSGNVLEWVDNCGAGKCWVRGGSFADRQAQMRCSAKSEEDLLVALDLVGFRCCAD